MGHHVECFWNISFAVMIITAILGNIAVLYIVISKAQISKLETNIVRIFVENTTMSIT